MFTFQAGGPRINIQYEKTKREAKEIWLNVQLWHKFLRQQKWLQNGKNNRGD